MRILKIDNKYDLKTLRQISKEVKHFDHGLRSLIEQMKDLCYEEGGAGLSAIQVGEPIRVLIYALDLNLDRFGAMVNPVIKYASYKEMSDMKEGCLSVPDKVVKIQRPKMIFISFYDGRGRNIVKKLKSPKSIIVQHEIDHLNGKLIVDYE